MNIDLDMLRYYITPLVAILVGIVSYFYKDWKDTIDVYYCDLSHITHVLETDLLLMDFLDLSTEHGKKARDELAVLPPFRHHNLGILDETICLTIKTANTIIIAYKYAPASMERALRNSSVTQLRNCQDVFSCVTACIKELSNGALLYFFAPFILQRKLHKTLRQQP